MRPIKWLERFAVACAALFSCTAGALPWTEVGDAGALLGTAQATFGSGALTQISGGLSANPASLDLVDLYRINITTPVAFSVSTGLGGAGLIADPALFLFNASGRGVFTNDDRDGGGSGGSAAQSLLAPGVLTALGSGTYYLAVTFSGVNPFDSLDNLIFNQANFPNTSPAASALALASWQGGPGSPNFDLAGRYNLVLTGTDFLVPEPASLLLIGLALVLIHATRRAALRR